MPNEISNLWRNNKTGQLYLVLGFAYLEATGELQVRYTHASPETGATPVEWIRHIDIFKEKFTPFYTQMFAIPEIKKITQKS